MDERLQRLLDEALPTSTDAGIIRGVSEGVALADDLVENNRILRTAAGNDLRGHLRRAGIMFRLRDLCMKKELPFAAEIVAMPHGPWHWLEIRSGNFLAHVCRTTAPHAFPEDTLSRQDARLRNSEDLFAPKAADRDGLIVSIREFYAWLTFGIGPQGVIEHLCWAMPPADEGDWLAYRDVLHHAAVAAPTQPEQQAPEEQSTSPAQNSEALKLRFKEHIEKTLSDKDKKDDTKDEKK
jgi:hypothetical protein